MESRLAAAIDALYDAIQAADLGVDVWDGPVVSGNSGDAIFIGYDADPEGGGQAGDSSQQWAGLGRKARDESLGIVCAAISLVGDSDARWKPARDRAVSLIESVGQVLRADPSLGQGPPFAAELQPGEYFQEPGPDGYQARFVFVVRVQTRV